MDQRLGRVWCWFRDETDVGLRDGLDDGRDALRALGMAFRLVADLRRVSEQRDHSRVRVRKRSSCSGAL